MQLRLSTVTEEVTVVGQTSPLVDVTRAVTGTNITLRLTESLPTGRSYQSYLQLVPGVAPDSQISAGNPASRSGVNWKENSATSDNIGGSTDNVYYFEGINVTDPVTGTFGANLNTEIIQEQKVITGASRPSTSGASGLISTVITKSGSNSYSGSYNYFFRNDGFVAENVHSPGAKFSTRTRRSRSAVRSVKNSCGASAASATSTTDAGRQCVRHAAVPPPTSQTTQKQGFAKGELDAPRQNDMVTFTFLNDPQTRDADTDASVANSRIRRREQGGNNYSAGYNRVLELAPVVDGGVNYHDAAISDFTVGRTSRATRWRSRPATFGRWPTSSLACFGQNFPETRPTWQARGSAQYQWDRHAFKGGLEWTQHEDHRNLQLHGSRQGPVHVDLEPLPGNWRHNGGQHLDGDRLVDASVAEFDRVGLQRADRDDQHAAEQRRVLHRVRHRPQRHDHRGRAQHRAGIQQHRRQP